MFNLDSIFLQLRQAFQSLRGAPGLVAVSVVTIALSVAASTALFSVVKAVLLNALPYADPDELVWIAPLGDKREEVRASLPDFDDWRKQNRSFKFLAAYADAPFLAGGGVNPERTQGAMVTEDFFDTLGISPVMGRTFTRQEHQSGPPLGLAVIGHGLWQRAYGGDPQIVGRQITLIGLRTTVIGVMPPGFSYPTGTDVWVSARTLREGNSRGARNFRVIGRLGGGIQPGKAQQDLRTIVTGLKQQYPSAVQPSDVIVKPLASHITGGVRTPLLVLLGAVGLLLLMVCVNVANLLLVRLTARSREIAIRSALGAGRARLFRGLLIESLLLALTGGTLGVILAAWSIDLLSLLIPANVPRASEVRMDIGVLAFSILLSAFAGVLFGTLPSWRATQLDIHGALKPASRGQTPARRTLRLQSALVVSEVALSLMLVAGAGLLASSFARLKSVDPGFRSERTMAARLSSPMSPEERKKILSRTREILERVRALPGVEAAGVLGDVPFDPIERDVHFMTEGRSKTDGSIARWQIASPGLLEALKIPLLRGRRFSDSDSETTPGVAIISTTMAKRYWPDRDPIGDRIWFDGVELREHWLTIVGVVGDVRQSGLTQPAPPMAYVCYSQLQIPAYLGSASVVVRWKNETAVSAPALRNAIRVVQPEAAVTFDRLDDVVARATARERLQMSILTGFAAMALVLGVVSLYGIISYIVTSNRLAIGIRMALGARPLEIFASLALRALLLSGVGSAVGVVGFLSIRDVLKKVVFGVGPSEPFVLLGAIVVMLTVSLAACWIPSRAAMRIDAAEAIRME